MTEKEDKDDDNSRDDGDEDDKNDASFVLRLIFIIVEFSTLKHWMGWISGKDTIFYINQQNEQHTNVQAGTFKT